MEERRERSRPPERCSIKFLEVDWAAVRCWGAEKGERECLWGSQCCRASSLSTGLSHTVQRRERSCKILAAGSRCEKGWRGGVG